MDAEVTSETSKQKDASVVLKTSGQRDDGRHDQKGTNKITVELPVSRLTEDQVSHKGKKVVTIDLSQQSDEREGDESPVEMFDHGRFDQDH